MRQNSHKNAGITLIEAVVSAAIGALIFVAVSRMMVSTLQMSRAGSSHLTNMLAADIVLQQLLQDLKQARTITSDETQLATGELSVERLTWQNTSANPAFAGVSYRIPEDKRGLIRQTEGREHRLYPDRLFKLGFKRVKVGTQNAAGMIIDLKVSTPEQSEEHGFRRFVYLDSLPENRSIINDYLPLAVAAP
ncbi:MAG: prepilin-type N-terminal cleavage/methylation domain-containing protein [Candidatus Riflebacteria bacterium]|nr:prepilin-type N-terminal cleavage/methylation domain-containing protein [Candidatus Riflebacteria bacterium]